MTTTRQVHVKASVIMDDYYKAGSCLLDLNVNPGGRTDRFPSCKVDIHENKKKCLI
jgi:hypothetical protein